MSRQPALKILQSTPTDPSLAGPEHRLCQKCGLSSSSPEPFKHKMNLEGIQPGAKILFIGKKGPKDETLVRKIVEKCGIPWEETRWITPTLCETESPEPNNIRCCRPFILGTISALRPAVVLALGDLGLATLTGNCSKKVTPHLGRVIDIPELPEVLAYCTYHPEEQRDMKKPAMAIQKGKRLALDIRKTQWEELEKPGEMFGISTEKRVVGFDTEFDDDKVWTLSTSTGVNYVVEDIEKSMYMAVIQPSYTLAAHYAQVDLDALVRLGIAEERWLQGKDILDTFVLANMENENLPRKDNYGIEDVLCRLYRAPDWKHETEVLDPSKPGSWGYDKRIKRCGYDAWAAYKIYEHPAIQRITNESQFVVEWLHRMIPTYHRIKYTGVVIDRERFDMLHNDASQTEKGYGTQLQAYVRQEHGWPDFELTNNNHLSDLLYKKLKFPILKFTDHGLPSTDSAALDNLSADPFVKDLLVWRKANKLMSTWYGKSARSNSKSIPLYERVQWDEEGGCGYLPVNLGVGQTATGRRQSNAPNMQNWAKPTRQIVTSRFGADGCLTWVDYEKLEVFLLADQIKSAKLREYFTDKGGYLGLAQDLMGTRITKDHENYRATKATALAANYFAKPITIANQLYYKAGVRFSEDFGHVPFKEKFKTEHYQRSERLLQTYYQMFPEIYAFFMEVEKELLTHQCVTNRLGLVRHLPCPNGKATPGYNRLLNQAINFKIQSVAGFVTGISAVLIEEAFVSQYWESYQKYHEYLYTNHKLIMNQGLHRKWIQGPYLCNEVHDELVVDTVNNTKEEIKSIVCDIMTNKTKEVIKQGDPTFDAYLGVEVEEGRWWHSHS